MPDTKSSNASGYCAHCPRDSDSDGELGVTQAGGPSMPL